MDYAKINELAVKAMIKGTKWGGLPGCWVKGDEYLMITVDGHVGYFLPKKMIKFSTADVKQVEGNITNIDDITPENEIRQTRTYVRPAFGKELLQVFKGNRLGKEYRAYIDEKLLKPISCDRGVKFYQDSSEERTVGLKPVYAVGQNDVLLMMFMPMRIYEENFD